MIDHFNAKTLTILAMSIQLDWGCFFLQVQLNDKLFILLYTHSTQQIQANPFFKFHCNSRHTDYNSYSLCFFVALCLIIVAIRTLCVLILSTHFFSFTFQPIRCFSASVWQHSIHETLQYSNRYNFPDVYSVHSKIVCMAEFLVMAFELLS